MPRGTGRCERDGEEAAGSRWCCDEEVASAAGEAGGPNVTADVEVDGEGYGKAVGELNGDADGEAGGPGLATSGAAESADSRIITLRLR